MRESLAQGKGNAWGNWQVRENRPRRPNTRPEQKPEEKLMYQAPNKLREIGIGKGSDVTINVKVLRGYDKKGSAVARVK